MGSATATRSPAGPSWQSSTATHAGCSPPRTRRHAAGCPFGHSNDPSALLTCSSRLRLRRRLLRPLLDMSHSTIRRSRILLDERGEARAVRVNRCRTKQAAAGWGWTRHCASSARRSLSGVPAVKCHSPLTSRACGFPELTDAAVCMGRPRDPMLGELAVRACRLAFQDHLAVSQGALPRRLGSTRGQASALRAGRQLVGDDFVRAQLEDVAQALETQPHHNGRDRGHDAYPSGLHEERGEQCVDDQSA